MEVTLRQELLQRAAAVLLQLTVSRAVPHAMLDEVRRLRTPLAPPALQDARMRHAVVAALRAVLRTVVLSKPVAVLPVHDALRQPALVAVEVFPDRRRLADDDPLSWHGWFSLGLGDELVYRQPSVLVAYLLGFAGPWTGPRSRRTCGCDALVAYGQAL
ncbi:hypothetical protein EXIGLDRAFT_727776 [Exidia glandulosa HHB12029]|uniref:Uncharacterized protein n=1 Tax=Exidia glandulosa HHB12029 TaxID=1314781 RepID=A0A165ZM34_EXIGL|nr:hypothetical protein EXIGLDRAFT_727776 [Exidia glandulosa HHB12029]